MRSGPTAKPSIARRTGLSAAQPMPPMKLETTRCHSSSRPAAAIAATATATASEIDTVATSARRRSIRSASAPSGTPSSAIGTRRTSVSAATQLADPVTW